MRPVVIVIVLPLFQLRVEEVNVVRNAVAIEELVKLLVDAMGSLDLAVQVGCPGPNVDVADVEASRCQWKWDWNSAPLSV